MVCQHPPQQVREYAGVRVCRECGDTHAGAGVWPADRRLHHQDGSLRTLAGSVVYRDWLWSRLR